MISDERRCELAINLRVIAYAGGTCADVMLVLDKACGRFVDSDLLLMMANAVDPEEESEDGD